MRDMMIAPFDIHYCAFKWRKKNDWPKKEKNGQAFTGCK